MPRLAAFVFGLVAIAAFAGEDEPVKRPFVEVGDCWTYRTTDKSRPGPPGSLNICVTHIDREKNLILAVARTKDGREVDYTYTGEWGDVVNAANVNTQPTQYLRFPLRLGDSHSFVQEYHNKSSQGQDWGKVLWNMKVIGWEDVTVPAGTFHALRIEGVGIGRRMDNGGQFQRRQTFWYAPAVNRKVKSIFSRGVNDDEVQELSEYSLNK